MSNDDFTDDALFAPFTDAAAFATMADDALYTAPTPSRRGRQPLRLTARHLATACKAWRDGGSMGLSSWLHDYKARTEKNKQRNFTVAEYSDAVAAVRAALQDTRDYSQEAA